MNILTVEFSIVRIFPQTFLKSVRRPDALETQAKSTKGRWFGNSVFMKTTSHIKNVFFFLFYKWKSRCACAVHVSQLRCWSYS